jgi:asparagine synthase (glutamine-hydrolysing)
VNHDGRLVDPRLLARMTEALGGAGPNAQHVWLDGAVGLGHARLRPSPDAPAECQPLSLDGAVWIAADARIDDRGSLVRKLRAHGREGLEDATDAALVLHAYAVWGDACLRHLLGDFAFAIWDGPRRRLFCARDHFGVKPFFYAERPDGVVFGTSLDAVRRHPDVASTLDEAAIRDFLRAGGSEDPAATCFAGVRRLPAAHTLSGERGVRPARYWTLPLGGEVRYRRGRDYVERFTELLEQAVTDRLRCRDVGVLMSGGLDSTTVAATARRCLARGGVPFSLRAYTTACRELVADPEPRYARLAAAALSMPMHVRLVDDYRLFERWDKPELRLPEPEPDPLLALHVDQLTDASLNGRVLLTGFGGDLVMRLPVSYAVDLLRRGRLARLALETARYVAAARRWPPISIRRHARRWLGRDRREPEHAPAWLAGEVVERAPAADRAPRAVHPVRPHAYALLTAPDLSANFETYDPGVTGVPVEVRHPFFDLRLVEYLLAIPPMPWCFDKTIVRCAMRGVLPEAVRRRPKTVAAGDPLVPMLRRADAAWIDRFEPAPALHRYVDRARVPPVCGAGDAAQIWTDLRPLCLNYWLERNDA